LNTALDIIEKTFLSSTKRKETIDINDEFKQIKQNAEKTVSIFNPNLTEKQITHSIMYLGWLTFFSFASIFGALAPLAMNMDTDEPHNHIPGSTFQI